MVLAVAEDANIISFKFIGAFVIEAPEPDEAIAPPVRYEDELIADDVEYEPEPVAEPESRTSRAGRRSVRTYDASSRSPNRTSLRAGVISSEPYVAYVPEPADEPFVADEAEEAAVRNGRFRSLSPSSNRTSQFAEPEV